MAAGVLCSLLLKHTHVWRWAETAGQRRISLEPMSSFPAVMLCGDSKHGFGIADEPSSPSFLLSSSETWNSLDFSFLIHKQGVF